MISSSKVSLNSSWSYRQSAGAEPIEVRLPHANKEVPLQYFDENSYQFVSTYERELPPLQSGKRAFLQFDGVMTAFSATVNKKDCGEFRGGYLPHAFEVTGMLCENASSLLHVEVDSTEREDTPPFGYAIDYLTFGGIYRDVWLYTVDKCFIKDCFFRYDLTSYNEESGNALCCPVIEIDNGGEAVSAVITIEAAGETFSFPLELKSGVHEYSPAPFALEGLRLWSVSCPNLYSVKIALSAGESSDSAKLSIGFRSLELTADGAKLNGKSISFMGLNRHQSYPYVGYAMPKRAQEQDARVLKHELGLNLARTSHYPQSPWFLDECDRLGLFVMEEIPGWQHVSKLPAWREQVLCDVRGMVERDRNHPSIISWGVRINESQDDDELYTKTNALARSLDPTRLTSGVRCFENSHLLEDIYTMNDFIHDGSTNILRTRERCTGLEKAVPYLVTEFCGHIYPTKRFDQEERLIEHALRHGRVQSLAAQKDEYMGAVGWCAFDYYTHYDFGSGDRICYHGVMDMFRVPKFAAAVYKSQRPRKEGYVLEPLTYWARGERDKGNMVPIYVFTNCRKIEVWMGDVLCKTLKSTHFNVHPDMQYLKNPPFIVELSSGDWGERVSSLEVVGFDDNKSVIRKKFAANPIYSGITLEADDSALSSGELDVTRLVIKAVDQEGGLLPFLGESFTLETGEGLEVIGPKCIPLFGGTAAFWVRTKIGAVKGCSKVEVKASSGFTADVSIELK